MAKGDGDQAYIRQVAFHFFNQLPEDDRRHVGFFFRGLDKNGDGSLTLSEILSSPLSAQLGFSDFGTRASQLFSFLDVDRSGSLDFHEFIALVFLYTVKPPACCSCGDLLIRPGYTCQICYPQSPYHICLPCFSSNTFNHPHNNLVHAYVLDDILRDGDSSHMSANQVQCIICGDYHSKNLKSVLDNGHGHILNIYNSQGYICEYCITFFCSNCHKFFLGVQEKAQPSQCIDGRKACQACGTTKSWSFNMENFYKIMANNEELMHSCTTCRIKVKNGTLFQERKLNNPLDYATELQSLNMQLQISNATLQMWRDWKLP